jgi:hypothetical protein
MVCTTKIPRVAKPLTYSQIAKAKPKNKNHTVTDGQGLFLRVRFSGTKDWIFRYKLPFTIKCVDMSFKIYPKVSLADARTLRIKAHELLAKDIDPRAFKEQTKRAALNTYSNSFVKVMQEWILVKSSKVSQDHANKKQGSLKKHVLPAMGNRPISELMATEVEKVIKPVQAKGHADQLKRLCQRIN